MKTKKFISLAFLCFCSVVLRMASAGTALLNEDFEATNALQQWQQEANFSETTVSIEAPGQLSSNALCIVKRDNCGFIGIKRSVAVSGGRWLRLSADVRAERKLPLAMYDFMVTAYAGDKAKTPNLFFEFDDGIQKVTPFGGSGKSPQTLGEWKKTEHLFKTDADVDRVVLTLVVGDGAQTIRFDNIRLEDAGTEQPPRTGRRIFARLIDWPYAEIDLDCLTPGCTYELGAEVNQPATGSVLRALSPNASLSPQRAPTNDIGMGVAMFTTDFLGRNSVRQPLVEMPDRAGRKIYRLTVPWDAVTVHLDMHNDDLIRFDHNQIEAQARRWGRVTLDLLDFGEIAPDNQGVQYLYRGYPESLKPRALLDLTAFDIRAIEAKVKQRKPVQAKVARINNGLCLLIDGKPVPPIMASSLAFSTWQIDMFGELGKNGVNIVDVRYPYGGPHSHGNWTGPDDYDFTDVDRMVYITLKQNPNAYLIFCVDDIVPPAWWGEQNPNELVQDQNGLVCWYDGYFIYSRRYGTIDELRRSREAVVKTAFFGKAYGAREPGTYFPSVASEKARATTSRFLAALRRHIESMPYGNAVIGYKLSWGYDGQWGGLGGGNDSVDGKPHYVDFSPPMIARFQRYAREKYRDETALRAAWSQPGLTFAKVKLPPTNHWDLNSTLPGVGYFLDPKQDQALIDYRECVGKTVGEQLLQWTQAIKAAGDREVLCLAYYPDIAECCGGGPGIGRGHRQVLAAPGLDMGGGPSYNGREIGLDCMNNVMLNSFTLHGKIPMTEIDHRVFPVVKRNYSNNIIFDTPRKSISVLRREYMKQMCFGGGAWTLDMAGGWFADPMIAAVIGDARRVFAGVLDKDRSSVARMALFLGEQGKLIQADSLRGGIPQTLGTITKLLLPHSGAPVDEYQMWDLPAVARQYKVFFFPFAYGLTDEERGWIESLKRDGNLLVFGYAAGYVGHDLSITNMENVLGMKLGRDDKLALTLKVTNRAHPITKEISGFMGNVGSEHGGLPRVYVDDPKAVALGEFVGAGHRVGLAFKDHGTWQSLYVGVVSPFPPELVRGCARYKNLHIYNAGNDVMYFNKSLVAIHANSDGMKTIDLPEESEVVSLWDGIALGRIKRIERSMRVGDNALYSIDDRKTKKQPGQSR